MCLIPLLMIVIFAHWVIEEARIFSSLFQLHTSRMKLFLSFLFSFANSEGFQKYITFFQEHHFSSELTVIVDSSSQEDFLQIPRESFENVHVLLGENDDEIEELSRKKPLLCESRPLDLVILLDSSRSIGDESWQLQKESVERMASVLFPIDDFNTRISLIRYGYSAFVAHRLSEEQSYPMIKEKLFR